MEPISIMINGLPGNVTSVITRHAIKDSRITLLPYSLTGPEIDIDECVVSDRTISLIKPHDRDDAIQEIISKHGHFISVDYTHPSAVNANAEFYCAHKLPFVMGTTGGDREKLATTVENSSICAIIAPNMAKQIVGFQAMMAHAAENFPGLFAGYTMTVRESHQAGKADTSGTAKAIIGYFNQMGVKFSPEEIAMERNPSVQRDEWGIPETYLGGHGWHTYRLTSSDGTVTFEFQHNVNGREIYAEGTMDAVVYLDRRCKTDTGGRIFTMIDVLRNAK